MLLSSFFLVFASEIGDRTQFLAVFFAHRFRRPFTVIAGVYCACLANFLLVSLLGRWIAGHLNPAWTKAAVVISFLGFALWMLVPEDEAAAPDRPATGPWGAFGTTALTIFLAEMGDKAQFAVLGLGAHFPDPWTVALGASLGMTAADALAVIFGARLLAVASRGWVRAGAFLLFLSFALVVLFR